MREMKFGDMDFSSACNNQDVSRLDHFSSAKAGRVLGLSAGVFDAECIWKP